MNEESKKHVFHLIEKAAQDTCSSEAMRFSQAALNAANALAVLVSVLDTAK